MLKKLVSFLISKPFGPSIEEAFFERYSETQRLMAMRTVYTAGTRGTKPGLGK